MRVGGQNSIGNSVGVCARNQGATEKHRTEVTEATEGELGLVVKTSIGDSVGVWARNQVQGESIAQRSRRSQRGSWFVKTSIGDSVGVWARNQPRRGKHRTAATDGGMRVSGGRLFGGKLWFLAEKRREHRRQGRGAFPRLSFE
jgi:hypothetical protein